jgi:hypothetical protein
VPMVYRLLRAFEIEETAALCGAGFFALTPSLILFLPQGDQAYPGLACGIVIAWVSALRSKPWTGAVIFGALLALGLFFSSVFLMLGLFLAIYGLLYVGDRGSRGFVRAAHASFLAILTVALLYFLLWLATGFNPIETFTTAARRSQGGLVDLARPWPRHLAFDFADIALGTGWISVLLIVFGAVETSRRWGWRQPQFRLVFIGSLQVIMAVLVAVFPGEEARLMLPIMVLLMAPIGIELARWPWRSRMVAYLALVIIVAVLAQNMIFLYLGPEIEGVGR